MKKVIFSLIALAIANTLFAQTVPVSQTSKLTNYFSSYELSCSDNNRYVVTFSTKQSAVFPYSFIVHDMNSNSRKEFCFNNIPNREFAINDIELKDGICYFCGLIYDQANQYVYHPGIGWSNTSGSKGIIGYFYINDVLNGAGHLSWMEFEETDELTHLAVADSELVYAIGYPLDCPLDVNDMRSATYIVCLEKNSTLGHPWSYDILNPIYDGELFMDISACSDGVFTVSRFQGDNYSFGVRYVKYGPLRYDCYREQIDRLYKFNTQNMGVWDFGENRTWRENYCPILIDGLTIGHVCGVPDNHPNGLMIYRLNTNSLNITNMLTLMSAQYIEASYNIDLLDMKEYYYGSAPNFHQGLEYVSLLIKDPTLNRSTIKRAIWNSTTAYSQRNIYSSLDDFVMNSITSYNSGKYLFSIGHRPENQQTIEFIQHTGYAHEEGESCLDNRYYQRNYPLTTTEPILGRALGEVCFNKRATIIAHNYTSTTVDADTECVISGEDRTNMSQINTLIN